MDDSDPTTLFSRIQGEHEVTREFLHVVGLTAHPTEHYQRALENGRLEGLSVGDAWAEVAKIWKEARAEEEEYWKNAHNNLVRRSSCGTRIDCDTETKNGCAQHAVLEEPALVPPVQAISS